MRWQEGCDIFNPDITWTHHFLQAAAAMEVAMEAETATEMIAVATAAAAAAAVAAAAAAVAAAAMAAGIAIEMIAVAGESMTFVRHTCPHAYLLRTKDVCI